MGKHRINNPHSPNQGKNISFPEKNWVESIDHPIFCFRYLDKHHHLENCQNDEKVSMIDTLSKMCTMTWQQIRQTNKHALGGSEKIARTSIKRPFPSFITPDVDHLLAFRFHGKKPFLGHRERFVFHVIFIDRDFTLYKHS